MASLLQLVDYRTVHGLQDFPPCSVVSEYIYSADLLKIIVFSVLLYLTRGSERKTTGTPRHSSTRSISMNAYKSEEIGRQPK